MGVTNKSNTISLYHGKAAKTMPYEIEILDYVLYNRVLGNDVTSNEVIFKLWSIDQTFRLIKILEYTSKWWYRFIKDILLLQKNTLISHKLQENFWDKIQEFVSYNIKLGSKYNFELNSIANID